MNRFIVISPDTEQIMETVQTNFPDHNYQIMSGIWAIADSNKVPSDIAQILGIDGTDNTRTGLVFYADVFHEPLHNWFPLGDLEPRLLPELELIRSRT